MKRVVESLYDGLQARRPISIDLQYGTSPVEMARNLVVKNFLQNPSNWLIQIDNDVVPPEHFLKLVDAAEAEGKRVFGIPTPTISNHGLAWNIGLKHQDDELRCNLFNSLPPGWNRCDYLGGAFLAVHRCVLEAIKGDWFNRTPTKSEDFAFSERARKAGFSLWFHGDSQCDHIHSASLLEMLKK